MDTKEFRYNQFMAQWNTEIRDATKNPKLRTYIKFKENFKISSYLSQYMPRKLQKTMAQFRTSSHKLRIETGRYEGLSVLERTCEFCLNGEVDDEIHLLLKCKYHDLERMLFLKNVSIYKTIDSLSIENIFHLLMSSDDNDTIFQTANFIHKCFLKRKGNSN